MKWKREQREFSTIWWYHKQFICKRSSKRQDQEQWTNIGIKYWVKWIKKVELSCVIILLPLYDFLFPTTLRFLHNLLALTHWLWTPPCQQMRLLEKCVRDMVIKKSFYHLTRKFYKIQLNKLNEMKTFSLNKKMKFSTHFFTSSLFYL